MNCPACNGSLKRKSLTHHLLGEVCASCNGIRFTLADYLYYLTRTESIDEKLLSDVAELPLQADTKNAMVCDCGKIMSKYRINHNSERRIDYCSACLSIWLDSGEWNYLKSNNLLRSINKIFTEPYQRKIRSEGTKLVFEKNYEQRLGQADYNEVKLFRNWLDNNPNKERLLAYINANDPYSTEI